MNDTINLDTIDPGMPVLGADGEAIGPVDSVHPTSIRVADREIPREAIAAVDEQGVHLRIAKVALLSHRDPDVEGANSTAAAFTMPNANTERGH